MDHWMIALDGMGGDHSPVEPVQGAVEAVRELGIGVLLVGHRQHLEAELAKYGASGQDIPIVHAESHIAMDEHPVEGVRSKPDSSIIVGLELVKKGEAAAFVSAGNTGAVMAGALLRLGRIHGVDRPGLGVVYPSPRGMCLVIDMGANADCRPIHLLQFGLMGSIYIEGALGIRSPRVGLLSIGEEETKGNNLVIQAHQLLKQSKLNFVGNIEGKDIPAGAADVVVTDGFAGNVVIKLSEGVAETLIALLREEFTRDLRSKIGAGLLLPAFRRIKRRMDYQETGGAALLGVNGVVIIAHGRSRARAIRNAIRVAREAAENDIVTAIRNGISEYAKLSSTTAEIGRGIGEDKA